MKKASALLLAVFYLSFSIGASLHRHYCMGELVGTSLFSLQDDECGKCGMKKHTDASKDCCKDITVVIKNAESHTSSQVVYDFSSLTFDLPNAALASCDLQIEDSPVNKIYRAHSPPLRKVPLFLQLGNFRI